MSKFIVRSNLSINKIMEIISDSESDVVIECIKSVISDEVASVRA